MSGIEVIGASGAFIEPNRFDCEFVSNHKTTSLIRFYDIIRLLMRAGFCLLLTTGCATRDELATLKQSLRTTESTVAEHTTALAAIKASLEASEVPEAANGTEVISVENEPQTDHDGSESQTAKSQPEATTAVRLFVTYSTGYCPPCNVLKKAIERGDLAGFEIEACGDFYGLKSYPAIRWDDASSPSGKKVLYGWSDSYAAWLRNTLLPATNEFVSHALNINPVMSHEQMIEIHNQLHGGGQWSWPGDLETHLRTKHGVQLAGIREQPVRLVNRGSACPDGRCPTSSRRDLFGWRR
jgi:hypothetical protein